MGTAEPGLGRFLGAAQLQAVNRWLPGCTVAADLSWHQTDTQVLHLECHGRDYILKTAGPQNRHFERELAAHRNHTSGLIGAGYCAVLRFADARLRLMVLDYLPGTLSEGTGHEHGPEFHRQAGKALRILHSGASRIDHDYESMLLATSVKRLDQEHRISPEAEGRARAILGDYLPLPVTVVPTHGDWQPRNWLSDAGVLRVIDFGRFAFRAPATDLVRLANQQWRGRPELEAAFIQGYGHDPRQARSWPMECLHEAIGTAVYAVHMGDEEFEAQGLRMLRDALRLFEG